MMERAGGGDVSMAPGFSLAANIEGVEEGWPRGDVYRIVVSGLPRDFYALSLERQRAALKERVPLTGTRWDALLAAVVEHVAWLHGLDRPAWVDEPERFLDNTWVLSRNPLIRENALLYAPPAFRRHGALPDPRDLDRRGGEWFEWVRGNWSPFMTIEHPTPPPLAVRVMRAFVQWWETLGQQAAVKRVAEGHTAGAPGLPAHDEWWRWDADEMAAGVGFLERSSSDSQAPPAGNPPESANRL